MLSDMSNTEDTKTKKEQPLDSQILPQATAESQNIMATASASLPTLPPGLKPSPPLTTNRNPGLSLTAGSR